MLCALHDLHALPSLPQSSKSAPNIVSEWSGTKASTEQTMKLMQMYKDLGDYEGQVRQLTAAGAAAGVAWAVAAMEPRAMTAAVARKHEHSQRQQL
jgi:hypothetical protein